MSFWLDLVGFGWVVRVLKDLKKKEEKELKSVKLCNWDFAIATSLARWRILP